MVSAADFQFSTFDSRRWGYIRGRSILYSLLQSKELGEHGVDAIQIISGHFAIRYQQQRSLVLFDAVISSKQMSEMQNANTESILNSKQLLPPPPTNQHAEQFPLLACSFNSPIVRFYFEKSTSQSSTTTPTNNNRNNNQKKPASGSSLTDNNQLRLYVFEQDAILHIFEWSSIDYRWAYIVKIYLPSVSLTETSSTPIFPLSSASSPLPTLVHASVFTTSQGTQVIWMMSNSTTLNMRQFNFATPQQQVNQSSSNLKKDNNSHSVTIKQYPSVLHRGTPFEEILSNYLTVTPIQTYEIRKEWFDSIAISSGNNSPKIVTSKLGIWFITKTFILLFSIRSRLWFITYYKDKAPSLASTLNQKSSLQFNNNSQCELHDFIENGNNSKSPMKEKRDKEQSNVDEKNTTTTAAVTTRNHQNIIVDVLDVCVHPQTQELMVLESSGRVFTCDVGDREALKLTLLAVLDNWEYSYPDYKLQQQSSTTNLNNNKVRMTMHQNALVVIIESKANFYDLKCGKLMSTLRSPIDLSTITVGGVWEQTPIGIVWGTGVWARSEGLWEIKAGPPLQLIENHLIKHKIVQNNNNTSSNQQQQQQNNNSNSNKQNSIGCAPTTCRQWDMKRLEAKYLLDLALVEQDEEMKIQICKALLPKLENPSLIIVLLSSMQSESSSKFIQEELAHFLEIYNYQPQESETQEEIESKQRQSLHLHTPLNRIMVPLLSDYYHLQQSIKDQSSLTNSSTLDQQQQQQQVHQLQNQIQQVNLQNSQGILLYSEDEQSFEGIEDSKILEFSNEFLELFKRKYPMLLLCKFERLLGLDRIDFDKYSDINGEMVPFPAISDILLQQEEILKKKNSGGGSKNALHQNQQHNEINNSNSNNNDSNTAATSTTAITNTVYPIFETLCQLYYREKPQRLIPFIRIVYNASTAKMLESQANATFSASASTSMEVTKFIPQNDHFTRALLSLPTLIPTDDAKIEAKFKLLCAIGHKSNALRLLLSAGKWDKAVQVVKNSTYNDKEHYVLFEILFSYCIEKKDSIKLKQCWTVIPKNYSVFNLFSILKPNQSVDKSGNSASSSGFFGETMNGSIPHGSTLPQTKIVSINANDDLTIDMFRSQLLKLLN